VLTIGHSDINSPSISTIWALIQLMNRKLDYNTEPTLYTERYHLGSACSIYTFWDCMSFVNGMVAMLRPINQKSWYRILGSTYHLLLM
jgi:hypothetical protein